jgi:transposase
MCDNFRMRSLTPVVLTDSQRMELVSLTRSSRVPSVVGFRARIVLALANDRNTVEVAEELDTSPPTVRLWRGRYLREGVDGLCDRARSGRPPVVDESMVVAVTLTPPPAESGLTHWSSRELAKQIKISHNEIASIWRAWGIQPHRTESFKFSTDPELEAKITDIVGLYMDPPENAIVLCIDEKSQIQALERAQPMLPVAPGLAERRSHDYVRHGTTSLFAALEVATGKVTEQCHTKHTNKEFLAFVKHVAKEYPDGDLHIVVDNYRTHKHANVTRWLARPKNKRITLHFTPTGCSWMNLVEVFFSIITRKAIRRGSFTSVNELTTAIKTFITSYNTDCKPFAWTKPAEVIITKATSKRRTTFVKNGTSITRY